MLQKWKFIINNWINCYFDKTSQDECHVNIESLLTIISNLRDNLNLDESKSSVLEAHTVEEFILEKNPGFKFKNGSIKASNEDDVYFAASLLLYFVCVNSKDMDMKSAMCSKLSGDDQEIILKFSKTLMDCSPITCEDVQAAIAEACSNEMATIDTGHVRVPVAETPPALRSLHGEVRRLQAALEAERFDRNFLQEELARTNLRVEKLLKDKEQYKLDIMNLKTKISLCCGENHDGRQAETGARESAKLARQLQDMEERLVRTQEMLDEAVYERDGLKAKLEGMKQDRDKWLALSQQESARTVQLTEELETERRQVLSLRELITELRMHNRLNRLDSSLLECDDPDASIQSLGHNLSVCSEACANIIDVQLGEERAKNAQLKQQIETLQKENEQLQFAIEEDNSNHELILKEKDLMINNLEQQLKQQATLLESLRKDHETVTLSWEKHKLKTRDIIEVKDEHIKKLNDHLVSLKQEFAELEIVRDTLKKNIDVLVKEYNDEKENLVSLLDEEKSKYDVILQEKDMLQNQLLEEKAAKDILETEKVNLIATHNELSSEKAILANELAEEKSLRQVLTDKKNELSAQKVATEKKFSKQVKQVEKKLAKEVAKVAVVLQEKEQIVQQLKEEKSLRESAEKEKADLVIEKTHLEKAKEELKKEVDQLFANRDSLEQNCLEQKEINIELKEELEKEKLAKNDLFQEKEVLKRDLVDHKAIQEVLNNDKKLLIEEKNGLIQSLELEKSAHDELENEKTGLCSKLKVLNEQFVSELKSKEDELEKATEGMKQLAIKFKGQKELTHQISATLHVALGKLTQELNMKEFTNTDLQDVIKVEDDDMSAVEKCDLLIHISNALYSEAVMKIDLEKDLESKKAALEEAREVLKQNEMQIFELQAEMKQLQQIATEAKSELIQQNDNYTSALKNKQTEIQSLQHENQHLKNDLNTTKIQLDLKVNSLKELLVNKENATDQLKEQYECQINNLNVMVNTLTNYLEDKTAELECAGNERDWLQQVIEENHKGIKSLQNEVDVFRQSLEKVVSDCESDKLVLKNMVTDAESMMENQKLSLNNTISELTKANNMLQNENKSIKDLIEKKTELFEREINKKESTLKSTEKELIELKIAKQDIEQKIILQKEVSDKELGSLRAENQNKHDENRRLKDKMRAVKAQKKVLNQEINKLKAAIQDKKNKLKTMVIDKNEYETTIRNYEETIKCLEEEVKNEKLNQEKLMEDFESERQIIKNMVAVTESVMEDQKVTFNNIILEQTKTIKMVKEENRSIVEEIEIKKKEFEIKLQEKQTALEMLLKELAEVKQEKENEKKDKILQKEMLETEINDLKSAIQKKEDESKRLTEEINLLAATNQNYKEDAASLANENNELKIKNDEIQVEFRNKVEKLTASLQEQIDNKKDLNIELDKTTNNIATMESQLKDLKEKINTLEQEKSDLILEKDGYLAKVNEIQSTLQTNLTKASEEIAKSKKDVNDLVNEVDKLKSDNKAFEQEIDKLKSDNSELSKVIDKLKNEKDELSKEIVILKIHNAELSEGFDKLKTENNKLLDEATKSKASDTELVNTIEEKITAITKLEQVIKQEQEKHKKLQDDIANEKVNLVNKCDILENYHTKAEKELEERQKEILSLQKEVTTLQAKVEYSITQSAAKDGLISKMSKEKDAVISDLNKNLLEEKVLREKYQREFEEKIATVCELKKNLNEMNNERKALSILKKENEELIKAVGQRETFAVRSHENTSSRKYSGQIAERELRDIHHQKQLYTEQIAVFKEKQKEEIAMLERELARARDTLSQSSRAYEEHIRSLTTELWSVGEKFLMQKDEANFLRRKQRSGSLMSLQHVHSSGFVPPQEDPGRPSDTQSLRSLPVNNNNNNNGAKKEGRGLHMSDEEGEVFDNRYLRELTTPRRDNDPARLSELRWRNSLCPPHLKSSYPAETQFAPVADEDDIKAMGGPGTTAVRQQRKEVGIIAYKKPGPPTPSKQAGRLSATDSELRESMRVEAEPQASRKTSTPSRIRSLFRSNKTDTTDGTPRSRRLSNIFRKK